MDVLSNPRVSGGADLDGGMAKGGARVNRLLRPLSAPRRWIPWPVSSLSVGGK